MRLRFVVAAASVGVITLSGAAVLAGHLQGCAPDDRGSYRVFTGTSQQNHCIGSNGPDQDYLYGLGSSDVIWGQEDYDVMKGATGDDDIKDVEGTDVGDYDGTCHGAGADYSNVEDRDGKDDVYVSGEPDGQQDLYDINEYDDPLVVNGSCPIADPIGSPPNPE